MREKAVYALAGLWFVLFAISFAVAAATEPTGDSFTRGLNRIAAFLTWQGAAFVVAMVAAFATRQAAAAAGASAALGAGSGKNIKLIGYAPLAVSVLLVVMVVAIIAYTVLIRPAAGT